MKSILRSGKKVKDFAVYRRKMLYAGAGTKEKYKNYLYIEGMPEDKKNVPFYEKHGFQQMEHGAAIQICNYSDKR